MLYDILAFVGFVALTAGLSIAVNILIESCKVFFREARYEYRYKHRFDKLPTAKCYCVDCVHYRKESGRCYGFHEDSNRLVADNCYCYRAEPRKAGDENEN